MRPDQENDRLILQAHSIVLLYHRITEVAHDPLGMCVTLQRFGEQLSILGDHARAVPLLDLLEPATEPRFCITFDDSYADQLDAAELLESKKVPATFFVVPERLDGKSYWWDRIVASAVGQSRTARALSIRSCRRMEPARAERVAIFVSRNRYKENLPITMRADDVRNLAASSLFDIGAHGFSHLRLSSFPKERQRVEIESAKYILEEIANSTIRSFSYPFGDRASIGSETPGLVATAGYSLACLNLGASVDSRTDRYGVPRVVAPDLAGEAFRQMVKGWLS